jgi:hypothetical protein
MLPVHGKIRKDRMFFAGLVYSRTIAKTGYEGEQLLKAWWADNGFEITGEGEHWGDKELEAVNRDKGIKSWAIVPVLESWHPDDRDEVTEQDLYVYVSFRDL